MSVWSPLFHHHRTGAVIVYPVDAKLGVELRTEAGSEKAIAEQPPGSIQNENDKLSLGNGKPMRAPILCQVSYRCIHVLDVVNEHPIGMTKAVVDWRSVLIHLCIGDDFRCIAYVLPIELPQRPYC